MPNNKPPHNDFDDVRDFQKVDQKGSRQLKVQDKKDSENIDNRIILIFGAQIEEEKGKGHDSGVNEVRDEDFNHHNSVLAGECVSLLPLSELLDDLFHDEIGHLDADWEQNGEKVVTGACVGLFKSVDDCGEQIAATEND